jgi:hypothetical protein
MGRLIEVQEAQKCPSPLTLHPGDVLLFHATGGSVKSGGDAVEMLGPFLQAVLGEHGGILTAMGAPNTVLFRARKDGQAVIDVVTGDPWGESQRTTLSLAVES